MHSSLKVRCYAALFASATFRFKLASTNCVKRTKAPARKAAQRAGPRSYANRRRNSAQARLTSGASRMADTTQIRCAPAASTSPRFSRLMPPMANHGMFTLFCGPPPSGHIPASRVSPSVLCRSHKPARWRGNPRRQPARVSPVPANALKNQFVIARSDAPQFGNVLVSGVKKIFLPQMTKFRAEVVGDFQIIVDNQADIRASA